MLARMMAAILHLRTMMGPNVVLVVVLLCM
jgi:hypothetical protein